MSELGAPAPDEWSADDRCVCGCFRWAHAHGGPMNDLCLNNVSESHCVGFRLGVSDAHRQRVLDRIRPRLSQLEADITAAVSKLTQDFEAEVGIAVKSIEVDVVSFETFCNSVMVVDGCRVDVDVGSDS